MKQKFLSLLLSFLFLTLIACGKSGDSIVVTYVVNTTSGGIGQIIYSKSDGTQGTVESNGANNIWRQVISVPAGEFVFVSAKATEAGAHISISARVFCGEKVLGQATAKGEDATDGGSAKSPVVAVETFASSKECQEEAQTATTGS